MDRSEPVPPPVTDVFLSHNWGQDALDRDNHDRVLRVNDLLTDAGYTTWCDSEQMIGDIADRMVEGIDNTRVVLVFITRRYMEKVASSTGVQDNCKKEFKYASRRLSEAKMIPVIMEPDMRDCSRWTGPLAMELGGTLWVDMSDDAAAGATSDGFAQLCSEIDGRIPGRTSHGTNRASLFQSSPAPLSPQRTASAVAIDGGYMDVVGGTPPQTPTQAPPGRLESDVSLITDGLDRQESDVSLITDPGIGLRGLSSQSEL